MSDKGTLRRLVSAAYEQGWRDGMDDHLDQDRDPHYPIGRRKKQHANDILTAVDPIDLLGLFAHEERGR